MARLFKMPEGSRDPEARDRENIQVKGDHLTFNFGLNPLIKRLPYHNLKMKGKF
tara:strand:+ start:82 stop:243 length:162 start_codon:yes stop_codon:yes gene_type:complete